MREETIQPHREGSRICDHPSKGTDWVVSFPDTDGIIIIYPLGVYRSEEAKGCEPEF